MIIDLHLKGNLVVVAGGGAEATRKIEALLVEDCKILVVADQVTEDIERWAGENKISLRRESLKDGRFLNELDHLGMVIAATDEAALNRELAEAAKKLGVYGYAADDPAYSDFSHPSVINLLDTVTIAISTGGRSPMVAKKIRETIEPLIKKSIPKKVILEIHLQEAIRREAKKIISTPEGRKAFLYGISRNEDIQRLLSEEKLEEAKQAALNELKIFTQEG